MIYGIICKEVKDMDKKLITDSGVSLPNKLIKENNIEVIPFNITLNERNFLDGIDIKSKELLNNMKKEDKIYKTSQVNPQQFRKSFEKHIIKGREIIYIGISNKISGTIKSAKLAKKDLLIKYPKAKIHIINSNTASIGQGLIVYKTAKLLEKGLNVKKTKEKTKKNIKNNQLYFTVDDLKYLYRGGRIGKLNNMIGGILNIKPILKIEKGKIVSFDKIRGTSKLKKELIKLINTRKNESKKNILNIFYSGEPEKAIKLKEDLKEKTDIEDIMISKVGCVIGSHIGPNAIGISFIG